MDAASDTKREPPPKVTGVFQDRKHDGLSALLARAWTQRTALVRWATISSWHPIRMPPCPCRRASAAWHLLRDQIEGTEYRVTPTTK